jgi:sugar phosphate isomerase/epimerase
LNHPVPFRLGVTSYVYPADLGTNIRALAPVVDDIELVFFESSDASTFPLPSEILQWQAVARDHDLTFTIHFPIDKALGSPNRSEREAFLSTTLRLVELCRPLDPHGWILHVEGIEADAAPDRVRQWQEDSLPLMHTLSGEVGDPGAVCLENLDYPFDWCEPMLAELPFSVCLDFGHLWQGNRDWRAHVNRWLPRTRIIHLYGTDQSSRHYSLARSPVPLVKEVLRSLGGYKDVLTLETFGYDDTASSLSRLADCL